MKVEPKYAALLEEYPPVVTKDQFYRIAHISKKTALFLLQSGLVPCLDSGKKTRRYKIKITDIIIYLKDRDVHPSKYKCPSKGDKPIRRYPHFTYQDFMNRLGCTPECLVSLLEKYYKKKAENYPDVLTIKDVAAITGYSCTSVRQWKKAGFLKCFPNGQQYYIPQPWLLEFLTGEAYWNIQNKNHEQIADFENITEQALGMAE